MLKFACWLFRRVDDLVAALALAAVLWAVSQEMFGRWFFGVSFTWVEDLSRVLLVVMVYFGASAVAAEDQHIRVEFVLQALPEGLRKVVRTLIDVACLAFALTATWLGVRLVNDTAMLGLTFAHSEFTLPVWVAQSCIPVAFGLMSIRLAMRLFGYRVLPAEVALPREG